MLELRGVHAVYGLSHVLHGVTLTAREGEVISLLGRNGAGKSTTLKAIMGLVRVTAGTVGFLGRSLLGLAPHEISRGGVGFVPEDRRIFADLTSVERVLELFPPLAGLLRQRAGSLSGGEQQMLTIARTLLTQPRVLLLDEPSEGLAPVVVRRLGDAIAALKRDGLTIVLSEQNVKFARRLADRAYIIEKGEIKFEGPMAALDADDALRRAYLGV